MGLAFVPVYIRYLGVEAWGLLGFMSMMQAWFLLLDMGLTPTLSREMALFRGGVHSAQSIRDLLYSLELIYGGVAVAVVGLAWLVAPWAAVHWFSVTRLPPATVAQAIGMMGLVLAARMVEQVYRGAILGLQRQVWFNVMQSALATLRWGGAVVVLAWGAPTIKAFFLWQGLTSLIAVGILARQTHHWIPPGGRPAHFDRAGIARIRGFAAGMAATTLLALLLTQVDKLLLSKLVSLEQFGYYTLAASVTGALGFLVSPIVVAISPHITEIVARYEHEALVETYHLASQWLAAVLIPVALVMAAFSEPLLYVWTGNASLAKQVAPLVTLLALGTLCNGFVQVPYATQLAYGWTGLVVRVNVVAVVLIVPAILWSVPRFGAVGAAWVWLVLNVGYVLISIHFMHRRLLRGEKWRWYRGAVFGPLFVGVAVVLVLRYWIVLPQNRVSQGAVLLAIGLLVAGAVVWTVPASRGFLRRRLEKFRVRAVKG